MCEREEMKGKGYGSLSDLFQPLTDLSSFSNKHRCGELGMPLEGR